MTRFLMNQVLVLNNMDFKFPSIRPYYSSPTMGYILDQLHSNASYNAINIFTHYVIVSMIDHVIVTNDNQIIAPSII